MAMTNITIPTDLSDLHNDVIDMRDLADILEALQEKAAAHDDGDHEIVDGDDNFDDECPKCDEDVAGVLAALLDLEGELYEPTLRQFAENEPTMVADHYFERYAEQLADDIGAIDANANWPICHIDWEAAAESLKQDYMSVTFDGHDYWVRAY